MKKNSSKIEKYKPSYKLNDRIVNLVADVSMMVERCSCRLENYDCWKKVRVNRIFNMLGSLAMDGCGLSEKLAADIGKGKRGPLATREAVEAHNALQAYEMYADLDAFSEKDFLRVYGMMMQGIVPAAGKCSSGKTRGLPSAMRQVFRWLKESDAHWLVRACVLHYEIVSKRPFGVGDGRMARLWQSLVLGKWSPVFEYVPVDKWLFDNKRAYSRAVNLSIATNDCSVFVEFMLGVILCALKDVDVSVPLTARQEKVVALLRKSPNLTAESIAQKLKVTARTIERDQTQLQAVGVLVREGSKKNGRWIVK